MNLSSLLMLEGVKVKKQKDKPQNKKHKKEPTGVMGTESTLDVHCAFRQVLIDN